VLPDKFNPLPLIGEINPRQRAFSLWGEFKAFAFKGNVIDLAVGVIIGAAFGKLVESLVKNLFMPLLASIGGNADGVKGWRLTVNGTPIPYGEFLADALNFLIVAAALFLFIVKFLGWVMRLRQQEAVAPVTPPSKEVELLTEIRDLLAKRPA
jgi:large conductance mechanosensitive channel